MLTPEQMQSYKRSLLVERQRIKESIEAFNEGGLHESLRESITELSMYDNHPGDVASEVFERSKDFSLRENSMYILNAVDEALKAIEKGTYGTCEECGREIPAERLEALPYTTSCAECKRGKEEEVHPGDRPVEEEVMAEVYRRPFNHDERQSTIFDWEDAFQEVADWNEHAPRAQSGSYYGNNELAREDVGHVEDVDNIPYERDEDGVIYQSFVDYDDEDGPSGFTDHR